MGKYGSKESNARRLSPAAREARYTAILDVLSDGDAWFPNQIGVAIRYGGIELSTPHGHSGKRLGEGSAISPVLQALARRGWIRWTSRPDGRSGGAYRITTAGLDELHRRRETT